MKKDIKIDLTKNIDYERLVEEEIEEYSNIIVTPDLREGGIHAHDSWAYWFGYLRNRWGTSLNEEIASFCNARMNPQILSLGCGYGGVEISVAKDLKLPFQILGIDLNEKILEMAKEESSKHRLPIKFQQGDLNFLDLSNQKFDVVMAHASLHHLLNLEHIFNEVHKSLKDDGLLIIQDVIGKTQVLFWKENVDFAIKLVKELPALLNADITLPPYIEPNIQAGMEGIRQEEIEEQIDLLFSPVKKYYYGSFMRLICTHPILGKRLDPSNSECRKILDALCKLDLEQIERGALKPTEILAVYRKKDLSLQI